MHVISSFKDIGISTLAREVAVIGVACKALLTELANREITPHIQSGRSSHITRLFNNCDGCAFIQS